LIGAKPQGYARPAPAPELLEGKKILYPEHRVETFAKAERKTKHEQEEMF